MQPLQQLLTTSINVVAGSLLVSTLVLGQPLAQTTALAKPASDDQSCHNTRTVNVSGAAAVTVTPDRVSIRLGVESNALTPEQVEAENTATIRNITEAVRQLGVADKDISTDYYWIQPIYQYDSMIIVGYRINNVVAITVKDINKTNDVLIAALRAGANEVLDVQFYTSELRRYRDEARTLAMKAATEKAELLANAGGAQTGCLLNINENTWSYYNGSWWGGRDRAMWTQNVVQNATSDQPLPDETPINVGQIVVKAEVSASFSLD
jgi:uncharacterized protein YggE